jgi:hypothetical protein
MKKVILGLVIGLLIGTMGFVYAESESFVALKASFKVLLNGQEFKSDRPIITVNGTTYLPLRVIGEALGIKVDWNNELKQVEIGENLQSTKYNRNNPCPIGELQVLTKKSSTDYFNGQNYSAEIAIKEIIRGDNAMSILKKENQFNENPPEGFDYILTKISFKLLSTKDDKIFNLSSYLFDMYSEKNVKYNKSFLVMPKPELSTDLYKDGETEGWVLFQAKFDDSKPKIGIGQNSDGSGGVWFKAYTE